MDSSSGQFTGPWDKAQKTLNEFNKLANKNAAYVIRTNSQLLADGMKKTIETGSLDWKPLKPITYNRKKSQKILRDTDGLHNSIVSRMLNHYTYFSGIPKWALDKNGKSMIKIGAAHEFGAVIRPRNRKALVIPITKEAQVLLNKYRSARKIPGLFKLGNKQILARKKPDGSIEPMFQLAKVVRIPQRSYLASTYRRLYTRMNQRMYLAAVATTRNMVFVG